MPRRAALLTGLSAVLLTSAAPPPAPPPLPTPPQRADASDKVKCRAVERPQRSMGRPGGYRRGYAGAPVPVPVAPPAMVAPPAPPPPPSPPPPPMPVPQAAIPGSGQGVVVTGALVRGPGPGAPQPVGTPGNTERYDGRPVAAIMDVATSPVSTFSIDVDTGAYTNVRRMLNAGQMPPAAAVRTEEFINYFRYDYPRPADRARPFSVTTDVTTTPWNAETRLLRIGLRGYDVTAARGRPPANLVFLVDVSGSMSAPDKLPLVRHSLSLLAERLGRDDRVSIVAYAGAAGVVLEPTNRRQDVLAALDCLQAGGSTAGEQGIRMAYALARRNFRQGGINRIFIATDGDFNVGISSTSALEELVRRNRDDGITLTTLGFGTGNYNEAMMERIADVGNGNYAYIDSEMEATKVLDDELAATLFTIASDVKVQVEFNPAAVSQYRLIGYENRALREQDFNNDRVDAGDMGAGHQVTALYEIVPAGARGWTDGRRYPANRPAGPAPAGAAAAGELAFVKLRYKLPGRDTSELISAPVPARLIGVARAPTGDSAFAIAVAAFGQRLRGDSELNGFGFADIRALAGPQRGYWRQEFLRLTQLAEARGAADGAPRN